MAVAILIFLFMRLDDGEARVALAIAEGRATAEADLMTLVWCLERQALENQERRSLDAALLAAGGIGSGLNSCDCDALVGAAEGDG